MPERLSTARLRHFTTTPAACEPAGPAEARSMASEILQGREEIATLQALLQAQPTATGTGQAESVRATVARHADWIGDMRTQIADLARDVQKLSAVVVGIQRRELETRGGAPPPPHVQAHARLALTLDEKKIVSGVPEPEPTRHVAEPHDAPAQIDPTGEFPFGRPGHLAPCALATWRAAARAARGRDVMLPSAEVHVVLNEIRWRRAQALASLRADRRARADRAAQRPSHGDDCPCEYCVAHRNRP